MGGQALRPRVDGKQCQAMAFFSANFGVKVSNLAQSMPNQGRAMPMNIVPIYRNGSNHPQAQVCAGCEVRRSALFGALDDATLDSIHAHIDDVPVAADGVIYGQGDPGTSVFTVRSGIVRFERATARGDRRIVRLAGRGDLIGQEVLMKRPYADDAVACTDVQLCRIPRGLVDRLGDENSALLRELMARLQRALDDAEAWVAELAMGPARRRVLRLLDKLSEHADASGSVWLPRREEMGAMLDMTVETASRLVSQLRREGVLARDGKRVARLDRDALQRALQQQDTV